MLQFWYGLYYSNAQMKSAVTSTALHYIITLTLINTMDVLKYTQCVQCFSKLSCSSVKQQYCLLGLSIKTVDRSSWKTSWAGSLVG